MSQHGVAKPGDWGQGGAWHRWKNPTDIDGHRPHEQPWGRAKKHRKAQLVGSIGEVFRPGLSIG